MLRYAALALCALVAFAGDAVAAISFRVVSDAALTVDAAARPRDIRWASTTDVYLGLGRKGVVRTRADKPVASTIAMPGADAGGFPVSSRIAAGAKFVVAGASLGAYGWYPMNAAAGAKVQQKGLLTLVDLDARSDAMALLGAEGGDMQGLSRDGAIAWIGTLSKNLSDLRPLMTGRTKPGGRDMARCGILETGAIRFMLDGSIVVAPGVEPGIFRYDDTGKLVQTWDTQPLGIVDSCEHEEAQIRMLASDFAYRSEWLASRMVIDDIVPLRNAVGVIIRRVDKDGAHWDFVVLPFKGRSERISLPVSVASPRGHLRADVRGDQLVLLLFDMPLPNQPPATPTRIVVLSMAAP